MREIKFRAWELFFDKWNNDIIWYNGSWYENERDLEDGVRIAKYNFAIEQFTGLHDKNGKEIYEGDIITVEGLQYVFDDITKADSLKDYCFSKKVEIIGNIHENPEWLKEERYEGY